MMDMEINLEKLEQLHIGTKTYSDKTQHTQPVYNQTLTIENKDKTTKEGITFDLLQITKQGPVGQFFLIYKTIKRLADDKELSTLPVLQWLVSQVKKIFKDEELYINMLLGKDITVHPDSFLFFSLLMT